MAFDGTNFLVAWTDNTTNTDVKARFVSAAGVPGTELVVRSSATPCDNPVSVGFNGTDYLVVWQDEVGGMSSGEWDVFGQLVTPAGALSGGMITITSDPGQQFTVGVASDGNGYLTTWTDMINPTDWNVYGQFIDASGSLVGPKFPIDTDPGNQFGVAAAFGGGNYFVIVNTDIIDFNTFGDVRAVFVSP